MAKRFPKTALLTGASGALGVVIANKLADAGVSLILVARRMKPLEELADAIAARGGTAFAIAADVGNAAALPSLVTEAHEKLGSLELLVNNAGLEDFQHFHVQDPASIVTTLDVNLKASILLMRYAVERMRAQEQGGFVVNIASTAGLMGTPYGLVYSATKAGLIAATSSLRMEYLGRNISGCAICPGFVMGGGMHEDHRKLAGEAPSAIGNCSLDDVANAVVRGIQNDVPEIIVNSLPVRPFLTLERAFPRLGQRLLRNASGRYMKKIVDARAAKSLDS